MKWNPRSGTEVVAKYPEDTTITDNTLMQVFSAHEYTEQAGMISLMIGSLNVASYYTGPEEGYYLILILNLDDDPDAYEGGLADCSRIILQNIEDDVYLQMIPSLFQRISVYPTLNKEQHLAHVYQDDLKRTIINRLREDGVISKSELMLWLKDKYKKAFFDLEGIINELVKREIIKISSVKGMPSELIFLTNDILMIRIPPQDLIKDPSERGLPDSLTEDYWSECKNFFENYRPSEKDNIKILDIFTNPQIYNTLRLLRTAIVTMNDLEKLKKKGVDDVDSVLKILWDNNMIEVFQDDKNNKYYTLISDIYIDLIFPKYQINILRAGYEHKSKADIVLLEYCNVLKNTYLKLKKKAKHLE